MNIRNKRIIIIIAILLMSALIAGCGNSQTSEPKAENIIRIGIFPIGDMLPLVVGIEEGYFAEKDLKVELVPFQSAVEKESAFQSGNLDGIITDIIVAYSLKAAGVPIKIGSLTTGVTPEEGPFGIVAAPESGINSLLDLQGKKVGISFNTIIEYVLDGLLDQEGLNEDFVEKVSVPKIPVRMEMLMNGQLDAAVLPEPLLTFAQFQGAALIADDTSGENLSQVVLVFHSQFVEKNLNQLKDFYEAYAQAVDAINSNPEKYHELFIAETRVPEAIKDIYPVPVFPRPQLPEQRDMEKVNNWLMEKELLSIPIKYEDLIIDGLY
ncbi:ABC transporter substrate-binding protein [Desulfitibacter alkalitolerans]|uniref:ABC transporter substrate-binding protein n=1 Tax=Desulfitibacter alkalitolerans TaxID=264641 RepID=UPI00055216B5|nr:MetQ/NlpA family ABC transporter substrate-binding protein [Desulfitibacter alkalitolerans]